MIRGEFPSIIKNHGKVGEIRGEITLIVLKYTKIALTF